jgi:hypothetical protein
MERAAAHLGRVCKGDMMLLAGLITEVPRQTHRPEVTLSGPRHAIDLAQQP